MTMPMTMPPIADDVPCVRCGYNLRTLPADGACAECGHPVAESLRTFVVRGTELGGLRGQDPAWLAAMSRGLRLATVAWGMSFVGLLYGGMQTPYARPVAGAVWLAPFVIVYVTSLWAAWTLARPRGMTGRRGDAQWLATMTRFAVVGSVASLALIYLNGRFGRFYFDWDRTLENVFAGALGRHAQRAGGSLSICWPLLTLATFARLVQLAWIARRSVLGTTLGTIGIAASTLAGFWYVIPLQPSFLASGYVMPALPGPTGTCPIVWAGLATVFPEARIGLRYADPGEATFIVIVGLAILAATLGVGLAFVSLRRTVRRAIELGPVG